MQYVVILFWYHLVIGFNKSDCYFVLWWLTIIACQTSVLIACANMTQVALLRLRRNETTSALERR